MATEITVTTSTAIVEVVTPSSAIIETSGAATATIEREQATIVTTLQNVNSISSPAFIQMNTTNGANSGKGRFWWSIEDNTFDFGLSDDVVLQLGQELVYPPVNNLTGTAIPLGTLVMADGVQGDRIKIKPAITDGSMDFNFVMGVTTDNIGIGETVGYVTQFGIVRQINTGTWPVGTILYPDPENPGKLTATQPDPPAWRSPIAIVLRQQVNTGRILVRMALPSTLGTSDTNVIITDPQDGDVLKYDAALGYWKNVQP